MLSNTKTIVIKDNTGFPLVAFSVVTKISPNAALAP
jgi:hypothetical protein